MADYHTGMSNCIKSIKSRLLELNAEIAKVARLESSELRDTLNKKRRSSNIWRRKSKFLASEWRDDLHFMEFLARHKQEYKQLTTTSDQRDSFRAHELNAIQNSLAPVKVSADAEPNKMLGGGSLEEEEVSIDIEEPSTELPEPEPMGDLQSRGQVLAMLSKASLQVLSVQNRLFFWIGLPFDTWIYEA